MLGRHYQYLGHSMIDPIRILLQVTGLAAIAQGGHILCALNINSPAHSWRNLRDQGKELPRKL